MKEVDPFVVDRATKLFDLVNKNPLEPFIVFEEGVEVHRINSSRTLRRLRNYGVLSLRGDLEKVGEHDLAEEIIYGNRKIHKTKGT